MENASTKQIKTYLNVTAHYCIWLQIITPDTNTFKNCNNLGNITLSAHMYKGKGGKEEKIGFQSNLNITTLRLKGKVKI